jgi:hypothetical protein
LDENDYNSNFQEHHHPSPQNIVLFNCPIVAGTTFKSEKKICAKTNKQKQHSHNSEKLIHRVQ